MTLLDLLNFVGRRKRLRLLGFLFHGVAISLDFSTLIRVAGRRLVTASAAAPAILQTCGNMEDGLKDPQLLYEAMRFTIEEMGLDTFCLASDLSLEAEACGCEVRFGERDLPGVISHPLETKKGFKKLEVPDPKHDGRMPVFLEAMRRLEKNYPMLKAAVVTGPFTLAALLTGPNIYTDTIKKPDKVNKAVEYSEKVTLSFAEALIEAGADIIVLAEPSASLLSPLAYYDFSQSYVESTIRTINRPCILHVCGNTTHISGKMCESGAVALSVDDVDMPWLAGVAPENVVIAGNLSNSLLLNATPEEVESQTIKLLESVKNRKEFFVLPGCDLAPETPLKNIRAFARTVKQYS